MSFTGFLAAGAIALVVGDHINLYYPDAEGGISRATCDAAQPIHDQASCTQRVKRVVNGAAVMQAVRTAIDDTAATEQEIALHGAKALRLDRMIFDQLNSGTGSTGGDAAELRRQLTANLDEQSRLLEQVKDLQDQIARIDAALARGADPELEAQRAQTNKTLGEHAAALTARQAAAAALVTRLANGDGSLVFRSLVTQRESEADTVKRAQDRLAGTIEVLGNLAVFFQLLQDQHDAFDINMNDGAFGELQGFPPIFVDIHEKQRLAELAERRRVVNAAIAAIDAELARLDADPDQAWVGQLRRDVEQPIYSAIDVLAKLKNFPDCSGGDMYHYEHLIYYWHGDKTGNWVDHVDPMVRALDAALPQGWEWWQNDQDCDRELWPEAARREAFAKAVTAMEAYARANEPKPLCDYALPPHTVLATDGDILNNDCPGLPPRAARLEVLRQRGGLPWLRRHIDDWNHAEERRVQLLAQRQQKVAERDALSIEN
jgi:hypothetical protein